FGSAHPLWHVGVKIRQLFSFLLSQFSAAACFKTFDRILALLRLFANDLDGFSVTEFGLRAGFCDSGVFQRRLQHAQHAQFGRVFGPHRLLQIRVHTLLQCHKRTITTPHCNCRCYSRRTVATIPGTLNYRFAQRNGYTAWAHLPTDSASPMEMTAMLRFVRFIKPASTLPGPSSRKRSQP